jgi:hypothetical protein
MRGDYHLAVERFMDFAEKLAVRTDMCTEREICVRDFTHTASAGRRCAHIAGYLGLYYQHKQAGLGRDYYQDESAAYRDEQVALRQARNACG